MKPNNRGLLLSIGLVLLAAGWALIIAGVLRPPPYVSVLRGQEWQNVDPKQEIANLTERLLLLREEADTNRAGLLFMLNQFGCRPLFTTDKEFPWSSVSENYTQRVWPKNYSERAWGCRSPLGDNLTVPFATALGIPNRRWELP